MKRLFLMTALAAALSFPLLANARSGGESNNVGCNGVGNANSPCAGQGGNGGQGGAGGQGGNAVAGSRSTAIGVGVGIGQGGRASATGGQGGNAMGGNATGGNATVTNNISGGGQGYTYNERRVAPDVSAPAIWSNNPCVISASGGVSGLGWGVAIGAGIEDADCTRRANAQHLTAMGEREAAREVLCENREVRAAFSRVGRPCAADQQAPVRVVATPLPALSPAPDTRPAYCRVPGVQNSECFR